MLRRTSGQRDVATTVVSALTWQSSGLACGARLAEERALALMEKHDHELEANPEQKRRLQAFLVPTGVA